MTVEIAVYVDNGNVYEYSVHNENTARDHASAIIQTGYRSVDKNNRKEITWYPPHRIVKVKAHLSEDSTTLYTDKVRGT